MLIHITVLVPRAVDWWIICTHLNLYDKIIIIIKRRCESEVSNNSQKIIKRVSKLVTLVD